MKIKPTTSIITPASHADLTAILIANMATPGLSGRRGLPLLIWGDPGTGKTASVRSLASRLGAESLSLYGSRLDPASIGGLDVPREGDRRWSDCILPAWVEVIDQWQRSGVLIVDELTTVPGMVQASLLDVILSGQVGAGYELPRELPIVALANPVEQAANGTPLALPMCNRFGHLQWVSAGVSTWASAVLGDLDSTPLDPIEDVRAAVDSQWAGAYRAAVGDVHGFLSFAPGWQQVTPDASMTEGAWASSRTWEMAARALASSRIQGLTVDQTQSYTACFVGRAAATEFFAYLADSSLPTAAQILGGLAWLPQVARPDQAIRVGQALAAEVLQRIAGGDYDAVDALVGTLSTWTEALDVARTSSDIVLTRVLRDVEAAKLPAEAGAQTRRRLRRLNRAAGQRALVLG